jgi:hypothetical protein
LAIENVPSIVFIDDSDVIFESGREHGVYRYLLTMLDGLERKSASVVLARDPCCHGWLSRCRSEAAGAGREVANGRGYYSQPKP